MAGGIQAPRLYYGDMKSTQQNYQDRNRNDILGGKAHFTHRLALDKCYYMGYIYRRTNKTMDYTTKTNNRNDILDNQDTDFRVYLTDYHYCYKCDNLDHIDNLTQTLDGKYICLNCAEHYQWEVIPQV